MARVRTPYSAAQSSYGLTLLCSAISQSSHVQTLELMNCKEDEDAAQCLATLVESYRELKHLKLVNCKTKGQFPRAIMSALKAAKNGLITLEISGDSFHKETADALEAMLKNNQQLTTLKLNYIALDDDAKASLLRGLAQNRNLKALRLSRCQIDDVFCQEFATILPRHPSLVDVDFFRNDISDVGATMIACALSSTKIERICLSLNNLTHEGLLAYAERLSTYTHLRELDLYDPENILPTRAFQDIVCELKRNMVLTSLSIGADTDQPCLVMGELETACACHKRTAALNRMRLLLRLNKLGRGAILRSEVKGIELMNKLIIVDIEEGPPGTFAIFQDRPDLLLMPCRLQ